MSCATRILLVDDDVDFVDAVSLTLLAAGYEVLTAHTASEGLRLVREQPVDIAIIDMMMEEPDAGAMLAEGLHRRPELQDIPIILVTSVTKETGYRVPMETAQERRWLGVEVWLDKPIEPSVLLKKIEEVTARPDSTRLPALEQERSHE